GGLIEKAVSELRRLDSDRASSTPFEAMRTFFSGATLQDFEPLSDPTLIANGLRAAGLYDQIVNPLLAHRLLEAQPTDLGLRSAIQSAMDGLALGTPSTATTPSGSAGSTSSATSTVTPAPGALLSQSTISDLKDLASAQVTFSQLKCHVEDNILHYMRAI